MPEYLVVERKRSDGRHVRSLRQTPRPATLIYADNADDAVQCFIDSGPSNLVERHRAAQNVLLLVVPVPENVTECWLRDRGPEETYEVTWGRAFDG